MDLFHFKLSLKGQIERTEKSNESSLMFLSNKLNLEIDANISRQEQEVLSSSNFVEKGIASLILLLIIEVVGTPQGPQLTRKTSGRSIGTYHFVEIVTVFFISFKLPVMNC